MPPPAPLQFDTQKHAWHAVRVKADAAGLTLVQKNILCACIWQESNFMNYRPNGTPVAGVNYKADGSVGSTDWGITQCNDKAQIGPGKSFPSIQWVMQHPGPMVDWMIGIYKSTGRLQPWYSFTSGAYKKHLPLTSPMWELASK